MLNKGSAKGRLHFGQILPPRKPYLRSAPSGSSSRLPRPINIGTTTDKRIAPKTTEIKGMAILPAACQPSSALTKLAVTTLERYSRPSAE